MKALKQQKKKKPTTYVEPQVPALYTLNGVPVFVRTVKIGKNQLQEALLIEGVGMILLPDTPGRMAILFGRN